MFGDGKGFFGNFGNQGWSSFRGLGPRFERGDIKLVILDLLREKPRHGYDIIQELENKFQGFYSPSSGTVYPTLQLLEDQDMITSDQKTGKKVYTITEVGINYLKEREDDLKAIQERSQGHWGEHRKFLHEMRDEFNGYEFKNSIKLLFNKFREGKMTDEKKAKIKSLFHKFIEEIEKIAQED
jgi:DNA-binding PadR family transcriptional regulator